MQKEYTSFGQIYIHVVQFCFLLYGHYDGGQSYMSVALGTDDIDTQEVRIVLVYWASVYRHIWHRLVYIHMYRLMHSTTLQYTHILEIY